MKKISILISAIFLALTFSSTYAAPSYNNKHLEKFENTNACPRCDLSNALISENHSGANLASANLSNINLSENNLKINLSGANLTNVNFSGANLIQANLSGADLTGAHFDGAYLYGANLYHATGVALSHVDVCNVILPNGELGSCSNKIKK